MCDTHYFYKKQEVAKGEKKVKPMPLISGMKKKEKAKSEYQIKKDKFSVTIAETRLFIAKAKTHWCLLLHCILIITQFSFFSRDPSQSEKIFFYL